jgi:small-conductance mechanosensitive channel
MMILKNLIFLKIVAWVLLALNFATAYYLDKYSGSYFGWEVTDFTVSHSISETDLLAVGQFILLTLTLDMAMRIGVLQFNRRTQKSQIPAILIQAASILIYSLVGLFGFILLYDHSVTNIIAASGAIGLSIGYVCRDVIADIVNSIVIQTDGLISIHDWIEISDGEKPQYFQVVEFDRRMVTLKNKYDYLVKIPNTRFVGMSYINLSKQKEGRGSRRALEIQLDSLNNPEKVLEILNLALEALQEQNKDFVHTYFCGIGKIGEGAVTYKILYECIPSMKVSGSESAVMRAVLRFLTSAGINTGSSMEVQTLDKHLSKTSNRLYETYEYSILKVLSHAEAMELSKTAAVINCFKGEQLIRHGERADSMFLLSEGSLEVKIRDKNDQLIKVATLWPGDCVGEMSLLTGAPRSADVFAKADAVLVEIKKENIAPILESNPRLINEISDLLAKRQAHSASAASDAGNEGLREQSQGLAKKILQFFFKKNA